jgi:6-pyruvoyltetrahydropterin/6-carboxytetrahydropterin synthase
MMQVTTEFHFSAGHRLPRHAGACRTPHGHNYRLLVSVEGPVDPETGMVIDFHHLKRIVEEKVVARLDHVDLNELLENPTAENIATWIWRELWPGLPRLSEICLYELHDCCVRYRGEEDGPG